MSFLKEMMEHWQRRRDLRGLLERATVVYARVFGGRNQSEMMIVGRSIFGIDGMFGDYVAEGGRVDIIGCDQNGVSLGVVRLV